MAWIALFYSSWNHHLTNPIDRLAVDKNIKEIDFRHGIALQFVNGKEWAFVSVIMIQFLDGFSGGLKGILLITSITTTGGLLAMILWTLTGHKLMDTLRHERKGVVMIRSLARSDLLIRSHRSFAITRKFLID